MVLSYLVLTSVHFALTNLSIPFNNVLMFHSIVLAISILDQLIYLSSLILILYNYLALSDSYTNNHLSQSIQWLRFDSFSLVQSNYFIQEKRLYSFILIHFYYWHRWMILFNRFILILYFFGGHHVSSNFFWNTLSIPCVTFKYVIL